MLRTLTAGLFLALAGVAQADEPACDDPARQIRKAETDAVSFYLQDAQVDLVAAIESFGCSPPATTETVASFWVAQGFVWAMQEEGEKAGLAYAAAKRVDPSV